VVSPLRGALVLAGGRSSRYGGVKPLARLGGKPLVLHAIDEISGVADEIIVVVGRESDAATYRKLMPKSVRVVKDRIHLKSPLVGVVAGFHFMKSEYSYVLSCDTPFIKSGVLKLLYRKADRSDAVIPKWPNGDIEPLQAVYKTRPAAAAARSALDKDEFRIVDMIKRLKKVTYVSVNEVKQIDTELITFFNINTRSDLRRASAIYLKKGKSNQRHLRC
jgi:molybdopterin-guanine dinucleotide biosynthesis protein A